MKGVAVMVGRVDSTSASVGFLPRELMCMHLRNILP